MRERCKICNSLLSENNTTGIGFGCMDNIVKPAKKDSFFKFAYLDVYVKQVQIWRDAYLNEFSTTKFRNEFKRSFYESIKTNNRLSKKQLEIIKNQIAFQKSNLFTSLEEQSKKVFKDHFDAWSPINDEKEFYNEKIQSYKIGYLSKRKTVEID